MGTPQMIWTMLSLPLDMVSSPLQPAISSGSSRTPGPPTGATMATSSCRVSTTTVEWLQLPPLPQSNESVRFAFNCDVDVHFTPLCSPIDVAGRRATWDT